MAEDRANPTGHSNGLLSLARIVRFSKFVCLGVAAPLLNTDGGGAVLTVDKKLFAPF